MRTYLDGTLKGTLASSRVVNNNTALVEVGFYPFWSNGSFKGSLDEVAIYGTALSQARITAHYNKGITG